MRLLLDTHALIWWVYDSSRLSVTVRNLLQDSNNEILLSIASVWEMQIKLHVGKLTIGEPLAQLVRTQEQVNGMIVLAINLEHVLALEALPLHHRDPFDRMLMAQSNAEGATLVSADPVFQKYPVTLLW